MIRWAAAHISDCDGVAAATEVGDVEARAHTLDHTHERILLDPDFDVAGLVGPQVVVELARARLDDVLRRVPVRERAQVARAIDDRLPIDEPGEAAIVDDRA